MLHSGGAKGANPEAREIFTDISRFRAPRHAPSRKDKPPRAVPARAPRNCPNGLYGLPGPTGAGKSRLMPTPAPLQPPTSGSIRFDGIAILKEPMKLRAMLGYLPQDFGVYRRVSAEDLLDHIAV